MNPWGRITRTKANTKQTQLPKWIHDEASLPAPSPQPYQAWEKDRETERGHQSKVVRHTHTLNKIKNKLIYIKCDKYLVWKIKWNTKSSSWKIPLFKRTIMSKTAYFFLLPHFFLVYATPVLQLCEFYDDIRARGWGHFSFSSKLNLWLNI